MEWLLRPGQKKHCSFFCLALSWVTCSREVNHHVSRMLKQPCGEFPWAEALVLRDPTEPGLARKYLGSRPLQLAKLWPTPWQPHVRPRARTNQLRHSPVPDPQTLCEIRIQLFAISVIKFGCGYMWAAPAWSAAPGDLRLHKASWCMRCTLSQSGPPVPKF